MKIRYASDLHLEVDANFDFLKGAPLEASGDVFVLAGDVLVMGKEDDKIQGFLDWCGANFKHTFIVPGNHEFYGGYDIANTLDGWQISLRDNVSLVNNKSVVIGDVELFFTTLWATVEAENEAIVNKYMPECSSAVYRGRDFKAKYYTELHETCMTWLDKALKASQAARKVVVTHHCPVQVEDPRYESNGLSSAFVNPMEGYVSESGVDAWVFGHTHYNGACGTVLGKTQLCTNQLGYAEKGICDGFGKSKIIEL